MQLITYTNLQGESVTFGASPPWILGHVNGTESADFARKTIKGVQQHGERTDSLLRQDRKLDLTVTLYTLGRTEMYKQRERLCGLLSAGKAFDSETGERAKLTYENGYGKWWTWAVPDKIPQWTKRIKDIHPALKLSFHCDSPYWFTMEEKQGDFEQGEFAFELPFEFPIEFSARDSEGIFLNAGQAPTPVLIEMEGRGEVISIVNRTTGKAITLSSPVPSGALLRISTDPDDLYVRIIVNGEEMNAFGLLDPASTVAAFEFVPGENVITYESASASTETNVRITWHDRFEGV